MGRQRFDGVECRHDLGCETFSLKETLDGTN